MPNKCSKFKEEVVHYYPETIVALPLPTRIRSKDCGKTVTRTQFKVELKDGLKGTYLVHVRSLSGQAINRLIDID